MTGEPTLRLTALEVVAGFPIGGFDNPELPHSNDPLEVLDEVLAEALQHDPCVVSFSGGRDSSAVLALATKVARREGLDLPVPVTLRFPDATASDEAAWQELVVRHLDLADWAILEFTDRLDLVGPIGTSVLRQHGLLWPPNTHFHVPILERARGGSILTGIDGDGLFASWRWSRTADVLSGRTRPKRRDAARILRAAAPAAMRRVVDRRRPGFEPPWMQPAAQATLNRELAAESATEPVQWQRWVEWYSRRRSLRMVLESFALLAADAKVLPIHPLAHPRFLGALARRGRWFGPGGRTEIMRYLSGDVLPPAVVARRSKAGLNEPFWNRHSRDFASSWTGAGVDADLVDRDALRREWLSPSPHAASSALLQAAWLATAGRLPRENECDDSRPPGLQTG